MARIETDARTAGDIECFMNGLVHRNPHETEFHQAVRDVAESVIPWLREHPAHREAQILERLTEPDRIVIFRVTWVDDAGNTRANRAWRVQFCKAIGPYKGGLRFRKGLTLSVLKFLGFEQIFKNSLTGLPMGGAKGGSDFNPKGKSDGEVMRFCQSLMTELHRHIGEDVDVPAGDIGVGSREISYLFGQYVRLENRFTGVLTGKGLSFGGSAVREEATGYGAAYFLRDMLARVDEPLDGRTALVSGSGNVALHAVEKLSELGVKVLTASDSDGFVHDPEGIAGDRLEWLKDLKQNRRGRVREYAEEFGCAFEPGRPWSVGADVAVPCATENELDGDDARALLDHGLVALVEGSNMPCDADARELLRDSDVLYAPGKASNAGGVAVSGLEQSQNATRLSWSHEQVDRRLEEIMSDIHGRCVAEGELGDGRVDYVHGANVAGFRRVADALLAYGAI